MVATRTRQSRSLSPAPRASNQQGGGLSNAALAPVAANQNKTKSQLFSEVLAKYLPVAPEGLYDDHFDVTSVAGQKLFKAATVFKIEDKDRLTLESKNKDKAVRLLKKLSDEFCWDILLDNFPKMNCNILMKPKLSTLTEVRVASAAYWSPNTNDPENVTDVEDLTQDILNEADAVKNEKAVIAYFMRIRSTMIAKAIFAHFNRSDLDTLIKRNSKLIQWTDATTRRVATKIDGPSLLKAILDKLMPGTVGQIDALRQKAKEIKLSAYGNDVNNMITELVSIKGQVDDLGGTFDDYLSVCFTALLSGPDKTFNNLIRAKQSEYYMGTLTDSSTLLSFAEANYNNLVTSGQWVKESVDQTKDNAVLAALKTELRILKTAILSAATSNHIPKNISSQIADWRYIKQEGVEPIERDGKSWYWCPKHKGKNGEMTGLYVTHKPEGHDKWLEDKNNFNAKRKQNSTKNRAAGQNTSDSGRLKLDDNLKSALVTGGLLDSLLTDNDSVN